jgi:nucleotide-binding universal stress UspA family protein
MAVTETARRIVVGVDGSASSIKALRTAENLANAIGARVDAVACWYLPSFAEGSYEFDRIDFEGDTRRLLNESLESAFGSEIPTTVSGRLVNGAPRQALIKASEGADMLVVGRRGLGGIVGLLLGSVSSACVAHAHCPVLVVHGADRATAGGHGE